MVKKFLILAMVGALFVGASPANTQTAKSKSAHPINHKSTKSSKHRRSRQGAWKRHGQQKIDSSRATEIQQALIREKYLDGAPTGSWDNRTEAAMARFQADNGWQSKVTPDSRALIKLGLGPTHQGDLLNFDTRTGSNGLASSGSISSTSASTSAKRQ